MQFQTIHLAIIFHLRFYLHRDFFILYRSDISGITYICIQVKENSLEHFTAEDAVIG